VQANRQPALLQLEAVALPALEDLLRVVRPVLRQVGRRAPRMVRLQPAARAVQPEGQARPAQ
jgi:hypothetical protein